MDKTLKPALFILSCFFLNTQVFADTKISDSLKITQSFDKLNINSDASDGCAFAGVWNVTGGPYGPQTFVITVNSNVLRVGYEEKKFIFNSIGIVRAQISPSGRSANGRWVESQAEGPYELTLNPNGLSFDATSKFGAYETYNYKGQKIQTLNCNEPIAFVEEAFELRKGGGTWKEHPWRSSTLSSNQQMGKNSSLEVQTPISKSRAETQKSDFYETRQFSDKPQIELEAWKAKYIANCKGKNEFKTSCLNLKEDIGNKEYQIKLEQEITNLAHRYNRDCHGDVRYTDEACININNEIDNKKFLLGESNELSNQRQNYKKNKQTSSNKPEDDYREDIFCINAQQEQNELLSSTGNHCPVRKNNLCFDIRYVWKIRNNCKDKYFVRWKFKGATGANVISPNREVNVSCLKSFHACTGNLYYEVKSYP